MDLDRMVNDERTIYTFYQEIKMKKEESVLNNLTTDEEKVEVIQAVTKYYCEDQDEGNALTYALRYQRYAKVEHILAVLRTVKPELRVSPITTKDSNGNNALQILIMNFSQTQNMNDLDCMRRIFDTLLDDSFKSDDENHITSTNECGQSALGLAIIHQSADFLNALTALHDKLLPATRISAYKELQDISTINPPGKSNASERYNLLMLALSKNHLHYIDLIFTDICDNADDDDKTILAVGRSEPGTYYPLPNSIRVAAKHGKWGFLKKILMHCVPNSKRYKALLEYDSVIGSALEWILKEDALEVLNDLLSEEFIGELADALQTKDGQCTFMEHEMSVNAIKAFDNTHVFTEAFLIPKPSSKLSRPKAWIFFNTFDYERGPGPIKKTKIEADDMRDALVSLGWTLTDEDIKSGWTFEAMTTKLEEDLPALKAYASFFLLCVTSHGKNDKIAGYPDTDNPSYTLGQINDVIGLVAKGLDEFIPKVIIIDVCRVIDATEVNPAVLKKNNILLLMGTSPGYVAVEYLYLRELAKQIKAADGATSILKLHDAAAEAIKPKQIPQSTSMASRDIILRNWLKERTVCVCYRQVKEENSYVHCTRCPTRICLVCSKLDLADPTLQNPHVAILCKPCMKKSRQI